MNNQKPELPVHRLEAGAIGQSVPSGMQIDLHSIFPTIQGEGPYTGKAAVFIRLAGCNIQCPGCDTEYTDPSIRTIMRAEDIDAAAVDLTSGRLLTRPLAVITGGEPFRQNIARLVDCLHRSGFVVQVETNGTLPPSPRLSRNTQIVCSPKLSKVNTELLNMVSAYKYVLDSRFVDEQDGLPTSVLGNGTRPARPHKTYNGKVFLSPMDAGEPLQNKLNTEAAVRSCMTYGYTLNLQVHKIIGMP